jgi:hypothetical protein
MDFSKLLTPGTLTGLLSLAAALAAAAGNTGLSSTLSSPNTVTALTSAAGVLAVIAGYLPGFGHKPS